MVGSSGQIDVLVLKASASQTKPLRHLTLSYFWEKGSVKTKEIHDFSFKRSVSFEKYHSLSTYYEPALVRCFNPCSDPAYKR